MADWVPNWVPTWMGGPEPPQDPQRSWDRDPDIKPIPTQDDAFEAAKYKRQFGDVNTRAIDIGDPYGVDRHHAWSRRFGAKSGKPETRLPPAEQMGVRINPQETDYLRIGQLQANEMPQSFGQFDPYMTTLARDDRGKSGIAGVSYAPTRGVWLDPEEENSTAHELSHLGYHDTFKHPEGKKLMLEMDKKFITANDVAKGLDLHEALVRANMQRNYGTQAEGPADLYQVQRAAQLNKDPEFRQYMRKLDRIAHHQAAERIIAKQGMVYRKGGPVRKTNAAVDPLEEYRQMLQDTTPNEPWMEADPYLDPDAQWKERGYMERPEDTGKPLRVFEGQDQRVYPPVARAERFEDPLAEGVRQGTRRENEDRFHYEIVEPDDEDESDRRQGKSVEDQLEEENEANRQRQLLKSKGYRKGGKVKKARAGMPDPYAEDRLDPNEPETPGPGYDDDDDDDGPPPPSDEEQMGGWIDDDPRMPFKVPEGMDQDRIEHKGQIWQDAPKEPKNIRARRFQSGGEMPPGVDKNFQQAQKDLKLTPQEQQVYKYHLHNLWTDDGYDHPDGGRSTYLMTPHEENGRWYALPGVAAGRILSRDESVNHSRVAGLDNFPAYRSKQELDDRYGKLHDYMEADTNDWEKVRYGPLEVGGVQVSEGYKAGGKVRAVNTKERRYFSGLMRPKAKGFYYGGDTESGPSTTDDVEAFAKKMSALDSSGYAGFASDAFALGRDIFDPSAQRDTDKPGDPWGLTGPYEVSQEENIGGDIGRPVGRAIGAYFGAPGAGAAAGEMVGGIGGAIYEGDIGKGFEHLGRGLLSMGEGAVNQGMQGMGGMGGGGGGMPGGGAGTILNMIPGMGGGGGGFGGGGGDMGIGMADMGDAGFAWARGGKVGPRAKQFKRKKKVRSFQGGGTQMADKGDIKTGRELNTMHYDPDEEFESIGYLDESHGKEQRVTPEDWPDWALTRGDKEVWRKRKRPVPTSAKGGVIPRSKRYQKGGVTPVVDTVTRDRFDSQRSNVQPGQAPDNPPLKDWDQPGVMYGVARGHPGYRFMQGEAEDYLDRAHRREYGAPMNERQRDRGEELFDDFNRRKQKLNDQFPETYPAMRRGGKVKAPKVGHKAINIKIKRGLRGR